MSTPIFDELNALYLAAQKTAKLEARMDLAKVLKKIPKPTKQVSDIIKGLENGTFGTEAVKG